MSSHRPFVGSTPKFGRGASFTPSERIDAVDPMIRKAGRSTSEIELADGESYELDGFVVGTWTVYWDDGATYAEFQTYFDSSGDPAVKIQDAETADRQTNTELISVSSTLVNDTVHFYVDSDGRLVLANGTGTDGTDRVLELRRRT